MAPTSTPPWRVIDAPPSGTTAAGAVTPAQDAASGTLGPQPTRLDATRIGLAGLALAAIAATGLAALIMLGGTDPAIVVDGASPLSSVDAAAGAPDAATLGRDGATGELVAEIVGAVGKPGVYRLPAGSRVADLVSAAGGYGARVDTLRTSSTLNLAAPLHDGDQVRVPSRDDPDVGASTGSGGSGAGAPAGSGPLDVNVASQAELEELPGVGPATAQKIITAREEAPFATVDELRTRGVLGEKTFDKLRDLLTVR